MRWGRGGGNHQQIHGAQANYRLFGTPPLANIYNAFMSLVNNQKDICHYFLFIDSNE